MSKRIAIIGAGYAGLSIATQLAGKGFDVHVYDSAKKAGGLARGIQFDGHDWQIEPFYHHWFYKEKAIMDLAKSHGLQNMINIKKTQ